MEPPNKLFLYGDDTDRRAVIDILVSLLDTDLVSKPQSSSSLFDSVIHVAKAVHIHMDTVDFEMTEKAGLGCRGHSSLYDSSHGGL